VFECIGFNAPAPIELIEWTLAEKMGWTLSDVRALSMQDLQNHFAIEDGRAKAAEIKR
jgi:hypothetical protein